MYAIITSIITNIKPQHISIPEYIWSMWHPTSLPKKGITILYNLLQSKMHFEIPKQLNKWETELNITITQEQWLQAIQFNYFHTKCSNFRELAQKIHLKWYKPPYTVSKFMNSVSNLCWRECGQVENLAHMFWFCISFCSFWATIAKLITEVTGIFHKLKAEQALLSTNLGIYPPSCRTIVMHILYAARLVIAHKWKSTVSPFLGEVMRLIDDSYAYEKTLALKEGKINRFNTHWSIWECFSKIKRRPPNYRSSECCLNIT